MGTVVCGTTEDRGSNRVHLANVNGYTRLKTSRIQTLQRGRGKSYPHTDDVSHPFQRTYLGVLCIAVSRLGVV